MLNINYNFKLYRDSSAIKTNKVQMELYKIDTIKHLEKEKLFELIQALISKLGYTNLQREENLIVGELVGPLSKYNHAFVYLDEKLIASENVATYKEDIVNYSKKRSYSSFFVFSNNVISKGFRNALASQLTNIVLEFIDRDPIINLINTHLPDFWKHDDVKLIEYEKHYCGSIHGDNELKKLQIFNEKYDKLLKIFIEPNYFHFYEDKATNTPIRKKVTLENIAENKNPVILSGNAGTGKTTSLKKVGEILIGKNQDLSGIKNLPVFITTTEIFDNGYDIYKCLLNRLAPYFDIKTVFTEYKIVILIDSIDELEDANQKAILEQLVKLYKNKKINFFIGTRNYEKLYSEVSLKEIDNFSIEKFNNDQIKRFISTFFQNEESRAENLLDALRDNRILEKLPITPLTLSLISILYEENNLEIPATITDIYDNFNSLLLGKAIVSSKIDFIDVSFRERILSLYALGLLERKEHSPMDINEFYNFFLSYYRDKTIPIRKGNLEDVLDYLIKNTGILLLKDNKYIQFSHDSFMEYYGAIEIFKHQRDKEQLLIQNFLDINWQNTAIFYAGKSKDMGHFLKQIIERIKTSVKLNDYFMSVIGLGYLMQALYQTDNKLRKEGVDVAVESNIQTYETLLKLSGDDEFHFKNYKIPVLQLMNLMYFYENFNSVTLKEPLKLSFNDFLTKYKSSKFETNWGYRALKLALTLNSKRINEEEPINDLILQTDLPNDPSLAIIADLSLDINKGENYKELKKELKKGFHKLNAPLKKLTAVPASKLRFSNFDNIRADRKIILVTEGTTDAEILEHAFMVLTGGSVPYWEIRPSGVTSGGAAELAKTLMSAFPILGPGQKIIGVFDRDAKGIQEFNGLKNFDVLKNQTLKKHSSSEIYAVCLPAIAERQNYIQDKQSFNFLEIEHYFSDALLEQENKLKRTSIDGVYEIGGSKTAFASKIRKIHDPKVFVNFIELFEVIDHITNIQIEYSRT
ncbi:NACHT domain-containing protein [Pontibacter anaerobius]|uniref:AAA family ATPase n=1 Tax=Pontibacter anaerobius TaxID=2993940 RepID=A0ABT3RH01_9BACT|nr:AAA family ATPase [Pontibacter anaerobius]MCX2740892.1 AAA family ATPase [Pontibacter anaerobius]